MIWVDFPLKWLESVLALLLFNGSLVDDAIPHGEFHHVQAYNLKQEGHPEPVILLERVKEEEWEHHRPEDVGARPQHLQVELVEFAGIHDASVLIKDAHGQDAPNPAEPVHFRDVQGVVDLVPNNNFLGGVINDRANEPDDACGPEVDIWGRRGDRDQPSQDGVAELLYVEVKKVLVLVFSLNELSKVSPQVGLVVGQSLQQPGGRRRYYSVHYYFVWVHVFYI